MQVLAAYLCPPITRQYLFFFKEDARSGVLAYLKSCPTEVFVSPERIEFINSNKWLELSNLEPIATYHRRLALHYLYLISIELDKLKMEDLEQDDESIWISQVFLELRYDVNHWADHVRISADTLHSLMDSILEDAHGLKPLDLAILHDHFGITQILQASQGPTSIEHCAFATASSGRLANRIFSKLIPEVQYLRIETMEAMIQKAILTGELDLLSNTISFLCQKSSEGTLPWNNTIYAYKIVARGDHQLILPILSMTNMQKKAQDIIEFASLQWEPRMLEDVLNYRVVHDMIQANQIPLHRALHSAITRHNTSMSASLINQHNMNISKDLHPKSLERAVKHPDIQILVLLLAQSSFAFDKGTIDEGVALNLMLHKAGVEVDIEQLDKLLKRGARMRYANFGITSFHVAAEIGRTEVMKAPLNNLEEADIRDDIDRICSICHREQGRDGKTALAIAAMRGRGEIVQLLLNKGADTSVMDTEGKTALELARKSGA
ncbi:hypothetical protein G6011_02543 [Alternaria panax]|uniref:Ankyrin n=1 Tax=Alternaria panax TaxID=48097 RepID=A0AAD4FA37_9PLEO|nr:hypothetical protein G6011_02543 [Alternaria panax]